MKIGVTGLGHIGYPIANLMHELGHDVFSITRSERDVAWTNITKPIKGLNLDVMFIASGGAKPNFGNSNLEISTTFELISNFDFSKKVKILYISSGAVYGECKTPKSESDLPFPTTTYGLAKLHVEKKLAFHFGRQLTILRLGNVIKRSSSFGIVAQIEKMFKTGRIEIYGYESDCRDYITISNFLTCIERLIAIERLPRVMNLCSGKTISISEIIDLLTSEISNQIEIIRGPRRTGDLGETRLNATLMSHLLEITPENPLEELRKIVRSLSD